MALPPKGRDSAGRPSIPTKPVVAGRRVTVTRNTGGNAPPDRARNTGVVPPNMRTGGNAPRGMGDRPPVVVGRRETTARVVPPAAGRAGLPPAGNLDRPRPPMGGNAPRTELGAPRPPMGGNAPPRPVSSDMPRMAEGGRAKFKSKGKKGKK